MELSEVITPGTTAYAKAAAGEPRWPGYAAVYRLLHARRGERAVRESPVEVCALVWHAVEAFADAMGERR